MILLPGSNYLHLRPVNTAAILDCNNLLFYTLLPYVYLSNNYTCNDTFCIHTWICCPVNYSRYASGPKHVLTLQIQEVHPVLHSNAWNYFRLFVMFTTFSVQVIFHF